MKTSVYIPCIPDHWHNIAMIVECYECGTVKPDEIVIFLSGMEGIKIPLPHNLVHLDWTRRSSTIEIKVIKKQKLYKSGDARNQAEVACSGDIIVFQDADDFPMPNRIEHTLFLFEKYGMDLLLNSYVFFHDYIRDKRPEEQEQIWRNADIFNSANEPTPPCAMAAGAISIRKKLLHRKAYTHIDGQVGGEDMKFIQKCFDLRIIATNKVLYIYRNQSSYYLRLMDKELRR